MGSETFRNERSSKFWSKIKHELPPPHSDILLKILRTLDAKEGASSVRGRYQSTGQYAVQGQVSLLHHSIDVALLCFASEDGEVVQRLAVIAGLGHDIGKLEAVHRGKYAAIMHAYRGAEFVGDLIGGSLSHNQASEVLRAIRNHHISGCGAVHRILRAADALARDEEEMAVAAARLPRIPL